MRVAVYKFSGTILDVANFHHRTGAYQNAATQTDGLDPDHVHAARANEETEELADNEDEKEAYCCLLFN